MLAAGQGNLCRGFETMLATYQHVHNQGFRPDMDMSILIIGHATTNSPNPSEPVRNSKRESIGNI